MNNPHTGHQGHSIWFRRRLGDRGWGLIEAPELGPVSLSLGRLRPWFGLVLDYLGDVAESS